MTFDRRLRFRLAGLLFAVLFMAGWLSAGSLPGMDLVPEPSGTGDTLAGSAQLEDPPQPLEPRRPRTQREEDEVTAAALFTHGRVLFQQQDFHGALQRYERAWRYDPSRTAILAEIVPLAFAAQRQAEAARYAILAAEQLPQEPAFLVRLAMFLAGRQEWARAAKLYEKALEQQLAAGGEAGALLSLYLEIGRLYYLTGEHQKSAEALEHVRKALEQPAEHDLDDESREKLLGKPNATYSLMGESFLLADRLDAAEAMFEKANEVEPNAAQLSLAKARIAYERQNYEAAREQLEQYLQAKSTSGGMTPYELLEKVVQQLHDEPDAAAQQLLERLSQARDSQPENAPLGYFLAAKYLQAGMLDKAEPLYRKLLETAPATEAYQGLVDIYHAQSDTSKLIELLGKLVEKAGTLNPLGEQLEKLAGDEPFVAKLFARGDELRSAESPHTSSLLGLAYLAAAAERWELADTLFAAALDAAQPPKIALLSSWGIKLMVEQQYKRAAEAFQQAIAARPGPEQTPTLYFYLSGAEALAENTGAALRAAKRAIALKADDPRFHARLPWILYRAGKLDEAVAGYERLLEQFADNYESDAIREVVREARMILSGIAVEQGRLADAEERLEQVLDEFPEDVGAKNDLGYLWADQGKRLERALVMIEAAVEAEPDNAAYRDSLGWVLYRLGRYDEAVEQLELAAGEEQPDGVILDHLGDAYQKAQQADKAHDAWRRAVKAFEEAERPEKAKAVQEKLQRRDGVTG